MKEEFKEVEGLIKNADQLLVVPDNGGVAYIVKTPQDAAYLFTKAATALMYLGFDKKSFTTLYRYCCRI